MIKKKKEEEFHVSREPKSTCGLLKKTYLVNKITIMLLTITRRINTPRTCKPDIFFKTRRHVIILVILEEHVEEFSKPNSKDCMGILHKFSCLLQSHRHTSVSSHINVTFLIHLAPALSQEWVHLPLKALSWT